MAPEFPAEPTTLSLDATRDFAEKSQLALDSLPDISTAQDSVFLPLLSPHQLQERFNVDEDSVLVMTRKSYPILKHAVDILSKEYSGIYVRGPIGIGKSYLLYLLTADYRKNREKYRVTYINDCARWRRRAYLYLLEELVTTFYDDTIEDKPIVEWCQSVSGSDKEEKQMTTLMDALINYTRKENLVWVVIFDQHNALFNPPVAKKFPFNLIDALSDDSGPNLKIVVSASANNEGYPTEMKGWLTHDFSSPRFDEEEFKVWCNDYLLEDNSTVNPESDEAIDALYWTGGVPYELDLLWKQEKKTLKEKTMLYRKERVEEMAKSHDKFIQKLSEQGKRNLEDCISRMALGLSPPAVSVGMDRQLFDIIEDRESGDEIITALNPVARGALIHFHGQGLTTPLGVVAEIVLKGPDYTNNVKGKISEMYITAMLELSRLFCFKFRKVANISAIGSPSDSPGEKKIEIISVVHFLTNKLPTKTSFRKEFTTLFVPQSPTYPRFDFFIWDASRQLLMGFQVTVLNPFYKHTKMTNSQDWQRFCFGTAKQTPMELYWVVPKCCIGNDTLSLKLSHKADFIIVFEDLISDFPALGKLVLQ